LLVFAVVDLRSSLDHPHGDAIETFIRGEDADRFIARVKRDDPQLASHLRVVERELEAGAQLTHATLTASTRGPSPGRRRAAPRRPSGLL
jgi:hypothetical protein